MPYLTLPDLLAAHSDQALIDLTDRADPPTGQIDTAVVDAAIAGAAAEVDSYLGQRYTVPLADPAPAAVADAALTIAWYRLHTDRAADKDLRIRYEDAVRWLRDVSAGRASLPGVATSGTAPAAGLVYVAPATPRLFGRGGPR